MGTEIYRARGDQVVGVLVSIPDCRDRVRPMLWDEVGLGTHDDPAGF